MSDARAQILGAVRTALGPPREAAAIAAEAAALLETPELIRPRLPNRSLTDVFAERISAPKIGATVERVPRLADFPRAVDRYLRENGLPQAAALQPAPELLELDWAGIELHKGMAADQAAGIGIARWGVAETGSLVFHSGPDTPVLFNFLPLHSVIAIDVRQIVAHLEDYAAAAAGPPPRNANIITGASGTTDIEGSYVRGAHGPGFLHVVIIGDTPI
ncbi:MAG: LUD domain-containing protein [Acetobacteraceae bacterium]|nr:LUD domain-containing protein [Acetobacteraceae bacterium]